MADAHAHSHDHTHTDENGVVCCSHHEIEIERWIFWAMAGACSCLSEQSPERFPGSRLWSHRSPRWSERLCLSFPLFLAAFTELKTGRLSSSTLAAVAIAAALAIRQYVPAGWLAFILVVFGLLVRRSAKRRAARSPNSCS